MNKKYNRWTVLSPKKIYKDNKVYLSCKCECGTERDVIIKNLKSGVSKSCGCIGRKKTTDRNTKHGKRFTKTWRAWQGMKNRCYNKNVKQYHNYGGRGITVCNEWRESFIAFYNYIGDAPKNKTLDRIDNNGNYEPNNVKWSTTKEQCQNKQNNRKINGKCISEIDKSLGGRSSLVSKRLKRGWSIERAITEQTNANI